MVEVSRKLAGKKVTAPDRPSSDREPIAQKTLHLPYDRNPFFTGRDQVLRDLHQKLTETGAAALTQAIAGLGGVGKTQTAVEYAYRYAQDESVYKWVFWIKADTDLNLVTDMAAIARSVTIASEDQKLDELVAIAKNWLETHDDWLLIFDNADHPDLVKPYRPKNPRGRSLLTSRAQSFGGLGIRSPLVLETLSEVEASAFLWYRTGKEQPTESNGETAAAIALVRELGCLPLALEQAAAYIQQKQTSFAAYLKSYRKRKLALLEAQLPEVGDYPASVVTTWELNFQAVEEQNSAAAQVLRLSAFLASDAIPNELLVVGAAEFGEAIGTALVYFADDPVVLDELLEPLIAYSLIRKDLVIECYSIHRLVQEVLKDRLTLEERRDWLERAAAGLSKTFPDPEFQNWQRCKRLVTHVETVYEQQPADSLKWGQVLNQVGLYFDYQGRYEEGIKLVERSLFIAEQQLGEDHPKTATSLNNLAGLYRSMGYYTEAEAFLLRALFINRQQLGENHPKTATSLNNLAGLYKSLGRYCDAEPLYAQALFIYEQQLGASHLNTAISLNNLAELYRAMGRYTEVESFLVRAYSIREQQLGEDHPNTAQSLSNLAVLYSAMGRYSQAEALLIRSLSIREQRLGIEHLDTAISLNNLAELYKSMKRYAEAEPLLAKSLAICEQCLGEHHIDTATTVNNLAGLYKAMRRYSEAEPLFIQSLHIFEQQLRPDHPNIAACLNNLAELYKSMGRYSEAEPLLMQSLAICEQHLNADHPKTATSLNNLAGLYESTGRYSEAEPLISRALTICEKQLGIAHPTTMQARKNLATLLRRMSSRK